MEECTDPGLVTKEVRGRCATHHPAPPYKARQSSILINARAQLAATLAVLLSSQLSAQSTNWTWARTHDNGSVENVKEIAVDAATGTVYAIGTYDHTSVLNLVPGPFGLSSTNGGTDAYLVKLDAGNNVLWTRKIGGTSNDVGNSVCIGPNGNIYVTGYFKGSLTQTLINSVLSTITSNNGSMDMFVACYNSSGDLIWIEKAGGVDSEFGHSIAANSTGVFVQGQFRSTAQFGSITVAPPTTGKDHIFVAKYPLTGGEPQWVRQAVNFKDNISGKITADENGAYAIGSFKENYLSWRTPTNGVLSNINCTHNSQNIYVTSFNNSGAINWGVGITDPDTESAGNAIAVGCDRVIISGRIHNGGSFPGYGTLNHPGAHDVLFISSLDRSTGSVQWVKSAVGDSDHDNEGLDLFTRQGRIYLAGTFEERLDWITGQSFTGEGGQEFFVATFSHWGDLISWQAETAHSDQWANAIAVDDMGRMMVGGTYKEDLSTPPFFQESNSNENIFIASRQTSDTWANDPTLWDHPGILCSTADPLDLNSRLRGTARKVIASSAIIDPGNSLGLPDNAGTSFNSAGSSITLDLGDTLFAGAEHEVQWRSAATGTARLGLEYSLNATSWTAGSTVLQTTSTTYSTEDLVAPITFRYIRLTRPTNLTSTNFIVDGITTRVNSLYGGTWSGSQVTATGSFDPSGPAGTFAITYTYNANGCTWSTTRNVQVAAPGNSGTISGTTSVCPGTSPGTLTLNGQTGTIVRWERSTDLFNSFTAINTTTTSLATGNIATTTQWRVLVDHGACGSVYSNVHTVTVADTTAPSITCPANITVSATQSCSSTAQYSAATAIDACGSVTISRISGLASNSVFPLGTTTITYKATDGAGNMSTCSFSVNVIDDTPPTVTDALSGPIALMLDDDCEATVPDLQSSLEFHDCSPIAVVQVPTPGSSITTNTIVTVTATASGGSTTWSTMLEVNDNTPPMITCPDAFTLQLPPGDSTMAVNYPMPVAEDNCSAVTLSHVGSFPDPGGEFHSGQTALQFLAQDATGNSSTCTFHITLVANDVPLITCPQNIEVFTATGICEQQVAYPLPTAQDEQDGVLTPTIIQGAPPGNFPAGSHSIVYEVTDNDGNNASCEFIIEVIDNEAPVIVCPDTTGIITSINCSAPVTDLTAQALVTENCVGSISVLQSPLPGSLRPAGLHQIVLTATDINGNSAQCHAQVLIIDTEPPTIVCPADTALDANADVCGTNHDPQITGTDNCGFTTVWTDHPGQWYSSGNTTVTAYASDASGNQSTCSFQVNVVDVTPPALQCPQDMLEIPTDLGSCTALVQFAATATDACGSVDLTYSHHTNGIPEYQFQVGTTSVTITGTDQQGLSSTCQFLVEVIDAEFPVIICPVDADAVLDAGSCGSNVEFSAIALDNCSVESISYSVPSGSYFTIGDHEVVCSVQDLSGNTATCSFTVSVLDVDTDLDGTGNCMDLCPDDPLKIAPGSCGCGQPEPGTSCDDNDPNTVNDLVTSDCNCAGQPLDCAGVANGIAYTDNCGFCVGGNTGLTACTQDCSGTWGGAASIDNCGTCVGGNTGLTACTQDCAGTWGGSASIDNCGTCVGGNTGLIACTQDCSGTWGGSASIDNCGNCVGGNTGLIACTQDCSGTWGGSASIDNCGNCVGGTTGLSACTQDCAGIWGGNASIDNCGICVGGNTGLTACTQDCAGIWGGTASIDNCENCVGGNTGLTACTQDCFGTWGGSASIDNCGTCVGGNTGLIACTQDCFGTWGGNAVIDNCGNCVGGNTGLTACTQDCAGIWGGSASIDNCGTCVGGNTELTACTQDCFGTWGGSASIDNCGNCVGGTTGLSACTQDCAGIWGGAASIDNCGTCVGGNTGISACTQDCAGIWGGSASIDNCGTCVGGNTGLIACTQDCSGTWGGSASIDNCGTCVGGNTGLNACTQDCFGTWGGSASIDNCGNCVGGNTGLTACTQDCAGIWGGSASSDNCGTCVGGNTGLNACTQDCFGTWGGSASIDNCGTCVGGNTGLIACTQDCSGTFGGSASIDNCGNCVGGNTGLTACTQDCIGIWGGSASFDNCGNCVGGNTGLTACTQDCSGTWGGSASFDNCGNCVGGNTGLTACTQDCSGTWGGTASIDNCGTCVGGNTGLIACTQDCFGTWGGAASIDNCGICVGGNTGLTACAQDCFGTWGGSASIDNCGTCVEGNTGLIACTQDCFGIWGGTASNDNCGTCVGGNTGLVACTQDCFGTWGGNAVIDNCGTCVGGNTGLTACTQDCAGIWGGSASIDNCGTCVGGNTGLTACTQDCLGTWGGPAIPGSSCNDNDPCTVNDVIHSDCSCWGEPSAPDAMFYYGAEEFCTNQEDPVPYVATPGGFFVAISMGITVDPLSGTIDLSNSSPGIHTIKYFFDGICPNLYLNTITLTDPPITTWLPPETLCSNSGSIDLNSLLGSSADNNGSWSGAGVNGDLFDPINVSGAIEITYTALAEGCSSTTGHSIEVLPAPIAYAGEDTIICGNEFIAQASAGIGSWSVPENIVCKDTDRPDAAINALAYGSYDLQWTTTLEGCTDSDVVTITFLDPGSDLFVDAGADQQISIVRSAQLDGDASPGTELHWRIIQGSGGFTSPGSSETSVTGLAAGLNTIELTARLNSCAAASDTMNITVLELFIPEGFSPNNDGVNDLFEITGIDAFPGSKLSVFNRWGQLVYENEDYRNTWDGRSNNGQELVNDTYFHVLDLSGSDTHKGTVILKR
jgi:gliding motility-associated-like protein